MLQALRVKDYVLFERAEIEFGERLNVVSGETGAGKSLLLGAVELLLGGESSERLVRVGAEKAVIEGLFLLPPAVLERLRREEALPDALEEGELVLRREISAAGRSRCFIGGAMANLAMLRRLGEALIQVHGQQEHQLLVRGSHQLELLDAFGHLQPQRERFAGLLARCKAVAARLAELEASAERRKRERELMEFQLQEIDRAGISGPDEEQRLEEELQLLENAEGIRETAARLLAALEEDEGEALPVTALLGMLRREFEALAGLMAQARPLLEQFDEARFTLEEVGRTLRRTADRVELDPERLEELRARRQELYNLKKKYGPALADVLARRESLAAELERTRREQSDLTGLAREREELSRQLALEAAELTAARREAAARLEREVTPRLTDLAMPGGRFGVEFAALAGKDGRPDYLTTGADRVTFLLSTNQGVPLHPLAEVASGGELSRVMLALKSALAEVEPPRP